MTINNKNYVVKKFKDLSVAEFDALLDLIGDNAVCDIHRDDIVYIPMEEVKRYAK